MSVSFSHPCRLYAGPAFWLMSNLPWRLPRETQKYGRDKELGINYAVVFWSHLRQPPPTPGPQTESPFAPHIECFLQLTAKLIPICYSKWGECLEIWRFKNPETSAQHSVGGRGFLCMNSAASWQLLSSQLSTGLCFPRALLRQSADLFSA